MQTYSDIIESFPREMQLPMLKFMDRFREETLDTVKRSDFERLEGIVATLGEQVSDLALAQKKSEIRLTRIEAILNDLAQAQKRTEERVEDLAQAQERTEKRVEELAEAQKKTEKTLTVVVREQKKIRKDFGRLSDAIGYGLEDRAIKGLPGLLSRDLGLEVNAMDRRFIQYLDGTYDEVNIYGEGVIEGEPVCIIGESKSQLGRRDVDRFAKFLVRASSHLGARLIPVLVTYSVRPEVEHYARDKIDGLRLYMSFEV